VQREASADWAKAGAASRRVEARNASGRMEKPLYRRATKTVINRYVVLD
jgi:hypothetical protein